LTANERLIKNIWGTLKRKIYEPNVSTGHRKGPNFKEYLNTIKYKRDPVFISL